MKTIKPSKSGIEDFNFYTATKLDMIGFDVGIINPRDNASGYTALECFYQRDTHGEILPCREIELLQKAERGKQSWNLQIKMWAEDIADGMLLQQSELVEYCHGLPPWIFEATVNQAAKICFNNVGFVPRFAQVLTVKKQWWPPYMRDFDPEI